MKLSQSFVMASLSVAAHSQMTLSTPTPDSPDVNLLSPRARETALSGARSPQLLARSFGRRAPPSPAANKRAPAPAPAPVSIVIGTVPDKFDAAVNGAKSHSRLKHSSDIREVSAQGKQGTRLSAGRYLSPPVDDSSHSRLLDLGLDLKAKRDQVVSKRQLELPLLGSGLLGGIGQNIHNVEEALLQVVGGLPLIGGSVSNTLSDSLPLVNNLSDQLTGTSRNIDPTETFNADNDSSALSVEQSLQSPDLADSESNPAPTALDPTNASPEAPEAISRASSQVSSPNSMNDSKGTVMENSVNDEGDPAMPDMSYHTNFPRDASSPSSPSSPPSQPGVAPILAGIGAALKSLPTDSLTNSLLNTTNSVLLPTIAALKPTLQALPTAPIVDGVLNSDLTKSVLGALPAPLSDTIKSIGSNQRQVVLPTYSFNHLNSVGADELSRAGGAFPIQPSTSLDSLTLPNETNSQHTASSDDISCYDNNLDQAHPQIHIQDSRQAQKPKYTHKPPGESWQEYSQDHWRDRMPNYSPESMTAKAQDYDPQMEMKQGFPHHISGARAQHLQENFDDGTMQYLMSSPPVQPQSTSAMAQHSSEDVTAKENSIQRSKIQKRALLPFPSRNMGFPGLHTRLSPVLEKDEEELVGSAAGLTLTLQDPSKRGFRKWFKRQVSKISRVSPSQR
ncbi:hypothetical protein O181_063199 [Austropuccinia psidii MF-1]|uniref:Uncharacterized protein n=1 Tax=Austropuccinia psidii MF-1 TaxID=1389203 RepID=A0A9Q3ELN2_9BASI|nr:hypothetical protein [Austropuccinia psidii MF-1]